MWLLRYSINDESLLQVLQRLPDVRGADGNGDDCCGKFHNLGPFISGAGENRQVCVDECYEPSHEHARRTGWLRRSGCPCRPCCAKKIRIMPCWFLHNTHDAQGQSS